MGAPSNRKVVYIVPRTWLGRLVAAVGTIAVIILAVFFFTIFLTVFAVLAVVIVARILWAQRQIHRKASRHVIDVEYSVEEETKVQPDGETTPSDAQRLDDHRSQEKQ